MSFAEQSVFLDSHSLGSITLNKLDGLFFSHVILENPATH